MEKEIKREFQKIKLLVSTCIMFNAVLFGVLFLAASSEEIPRLALGASGVFFIAAGSAYILREAFGMKKYIEE